MIPARPHFGRASIAIGPCDRRHLRIPATRSLATALRGALARDFAAPSYTTARDVTVSVVTGRVFPLVHISIRWLLRLGVCARTGTFFRVRPSLERSRTGAFSPFFEFSGAIPRVIA
jgi:hypothetical protein